MSLNGHPRQAEGPEEVRYHVNFQSPVTWLTLESHAYSFHGTTCALLGCGLGSRPTHSGGITGRRDAGCKHSCLGIFLI